MPVQELFLGMSADIKPTLHTQSVIHMANSTYGARMAKALSEIGSEDLKTELLKTARLMAKVSSGNQGCARD